MHAWASLTILMSPAAVASEVACRYAKNGKGALIKVQTEPDLSYERRVMFAIALREAEHAACAKEPVPALPGMQPFQMFKAWC